MADDLTNKQKIEKAAIDGIAEKLAENYGMVPGFVNPKLADADKFLPLEDKSFQDENGKFDRARFNSYIHDRAADIYEGKSDFAQKSIGVMKQTFGNDPKLGGFLKLLDQHEVISQTAADVADQYGSFSFDMIGTYISEFFKHGFDFDAIKKDIAGIAADDFKQRLTAKGLDSDTVDTATTKFTETAAQLTGSAPAATETYENTDIKGFKGGALSSISAPTPSPEPGQDAGASSGVPVDQAIDAAITKSLDGNPTIKGLLASIKDSTDPEMQNKYQSVMHIQQQFAANAKQVVADSASSKIAEKDPKKLADMAFMQTIHGLPPEQQKLLGDIKPDDTVDSIVARMQSSDNPMNKMAAPVIESLRDNVSDAIAGASQAPAQGQGAGAGTSPSPTPTPTPGQDSGASTVPASQGIDNAVAQSLEQSPLVKGGLEMLKNSTDPDQQNQYKSVTQIQQQFAANAKQIAADSASGKNPEKDPKKLADMAFKQTLDGLPPEQQKLVGPIAPDDTVDSIVARMKASSKPMDPIAGQFIETLRDNVSGAIGASQGQGAATGTPGADQTAGTPAAGASDPKKEIPAIQDSITSFNNVIIDGSKNPETGLPAQAKEFIGIVATQNDSGLLGWKDFLADHVAGRDPQATDIIRNYVLDTRQNDNTDIPASQRPKIDGARKPTPEEVKAFESMHALAVSKGQAPNDKQLAFAAESIGKITSDYLNELAKANKDLPPKEEVAAELKKRIMTQLPTMRDKDNLGFDDLGTSLETLNKNTGKNILDELTNAGAKQLIENQPEKLINHKVKPGAVGPYDQLATGYGILRSSYAQLAQATVAQAGVKPNQFASADMPDGTTVGSQSTPTKQKPPLPVVATTSATAPTGTNPPPKPQPRTQFGVH